MNSSKQVLLLVAVICTLLFAISCGSSGTATQTQSASMGTVNTTVSDPATCSAPSGPFLHVYVTITDVMIHQSGSAGATDAGWVDLTPNLKSAPQQVDLLGTATAQCFLATLGNGVQLQPGSYQQIRIILADNSATIPGNNCGSAGNNCVVLTASPTSPKPLLLSSESKTGIKIPSGQMAGGQFMIAAGETKDLNIDFNACASIVQQGNGGFRLKPVLHAGEASTTASNSISGKVVDSATNAAISGGTVVVAIEQKDSGGVDRVIMETKADATGGFVFCPVPAGSYDLVVVASGANNVAYAATITGGVSPGNQLGNIPMKIETAVNPQFASITGQVTTVNATPAGTAADVTISALQSVSIGGSTVMVTIPLVPQSASTITFTTASGLSCPVNTDCATYTVGVPASNSNVGTFASAGTTYAQASGTALYTIEGQAAVPGSGGTADCTPPIVSTNLDSTSAVLAVTAAATSTAATLTFTGCQ